MKIKMHNDGSFTGAASKKTVVHSAGKPFAVDQKDIVHLDKKDYTVVEAAAPPPPLVNLYRLNKDELIALAVERKITLPDNATKDYIIELLEAK